jgi:dienelactone hydrolase
MRWRHRAALGLVGALTIGGLTHVMPDARADTSPPSTFGCDQPAGDPDPVTQRDAWMQRDAQNMACATERQQDSVSNPAFLRKWAVENGTSVGSLLDRAAGQLAEPTRPHIGFGYWTPPSKVTDPFRDPEEWEAAGRGQMQRFSFVASTGAKLNARLYSPNAGSNLPGLTFSPGLQSYNEVNNWFAQGMAEAGYIVLIIDPQGQGDSENFSHNPDGSINCGYGSCPNTPTSDKPDTQSAIDFLLSTPTSPFPYQAPYPANAAGSLPYNPLWQRLDPTRIGIAGHSLGAIAATPIGQTDPRVKAIVSYDNLNAEYDDAVLPKLHAPTLFFGADYAFPSPLVPFDPSNPPDPKLWLSTAYSQLKSAGVDAMHINTRASTHYEFGYQPFPASFQASRYGERVTMHYTLAWFDKYVRGDSSATERLTTTTFDDSADASSIGAGTFDASTISDPADPGAGNVPYEIDGKCVATLLSFYYDSGYWLDGGAASSDNMRRRGCP